MSNISLSEEISKELEVLKERHFLEPEDSVNDIQTNHYETQIWADAFWQRRVSHATRPDPEIEAIFDYNPSSVLEIGAAYGRILKKLGEERAKRNMQTKTKLVGIEKCPYLEEYFNKFKKQENLDQDISILYDDFFNSTNLAGKKFDIIALTMNTFPEFGLEGIPLLFKTAEKYLSEHGRFMFSSYKLPDDFPVEKLLRERSSSELVHMEGKKPMINEFTELLTLLASQEVKKVGYQVNYRFSDHYKTREKTIYRKTGLYLRKFQIEQKISENGFILEEVRSDQYSYVFVCKKNKINSIKRINKINN